MNEKIVTVDVREEIRRGEAPCDRIMQAAASLNAEEKLLLIAPFEPVPLYRVLAAQGFRHASHPTPSGDWEVLFTRGPDDSHPSGQSREDAAAPAPPPKSVACGCHPVVDVDARGLEPPQPLVAILEALSQLPEGAELRARTDRRPMHLYGQLEARGFSGESEEQFDGSYLTRIRRN